MENSHLIVGLGNPGPEYQYTRHNFGFLAIDYLLGHLSQNVTQVSSAKDPFLLYKINIPPHTIYLMQPLTYMNKSGEAVQRVSHYYKISVDHLLVLHDELDIPFGDIRLKFSGGTAGHNGLKSIQLHLGSPSFPRVRLGIGKPGGYDVSRFVLSKFSQTELLQLPKIFEEIKEFYFYILQGNPQKAQQICNSFSLVDR